MATIDSVIQPALEQIRDAGLYKDERIITSPQGVAIRVGSGEEVLNFCANNYLGLSSDPAVIDAAAEALRTHGFGLSSVRFICGTQDLHKRLEQALARFLGTDDAILYTSCFDANGGLFETLLQEGDAVLSDALNHASIIDGIRLCKAARYRYAHADMDDLEAKLNEAAGARLRLIATDGVFSMDGDIAPLDRIVELARAHDALVMVDDSHATGFIGATGRGSIEHCGVLGEIDVITSTLGKALGGASGGFTAARATDRGAAPAALTAVPVQQLVAAVPGRGRPGGAGTPGRNHGTARSVGGEHRLLPEGDDRRRLRHPARRAPDRADHAVRGSTGAGDGDRSAGRRDLRDRLLLSGGAAGAGPHPRTDLGRARARPPGPRDRGVHPRGPAARHHRVDRSQ